MQTRTYECAIIGGGLAGLQAAIQLGRYKRSTAVFDTEGGRSAACGRYGNVLGWPEGVAGPDLLAAGRLQAQRLGVSLIRANIVSAEQAADGFTLQGEDGTRYAAKRLLLATGIRDHWPDGLPELMPCLGHSVYVCPDCDGYEAAGQRTLVIGSGAAGADMALELTYWTRELIFVNHGGGEPEEERRRRLAEQGVQVVEQRVVRAEVHDKTQLAGIVLEDGTPIEAKHAFVAMGGNEVRTGLAVQLGIELTAGRHIQTDARTKRTMTPNVWAAGDIAAHSQQAVIAMGDGAQAAIWMHKSLLESSVISHSAQSPLVIQ